MQTAIYIFAIIGALASLAILCFFLFVFLIPAIKEVIREERERLIKEKLREKGWEGSQLRGLVEIAIQGYIPKWWDEADRQRTIKEFAEAGIKLRYQKD